MARGGVATTIKTLLIRRSNTTTTKAVGGRCMSNVARWNELNIDGLEEVQLFKHDVQHQDKEYEKHEGSGWIPHPPTGIYYPKGHELVMKDVPDSAASFAYNYWLRSEEQHQP